MEAVADSRGLSQTLRPPRRATRPAAEIAVGDQKRLERATAQTDTEAECPQGDATLMKKINGFPLKQITTMKMGAMTTTSTMIVTAVDKTPIAKTTFDVPAGYKKVEFMQK